MSSKLQLTTLAVLVSAALPAQAALYKVVEVTDTGGVTGTEYYGTAIQAGMTADPKGCFADDCGTGTAYKLAGETRNWAAGFSYREEVPFSMDNSFGYIEDNYDGFEDYCYYQLGYSTCEYWASTQWSGWSKELNGGTNSNSKAFIETAAEAPSGSINTVINSLITVSGAVSSIGNYSTASSRNLPISGNTLVDIAGKTWPQAHQWSSDNEFTVGSVTSKTGIGADRYYYSSKAAVWNGATLTAINWAGGTENNSDVFAQGSMRDFYIDTNHSKTYGVGYNNYNDQHMDATVFLGNSDNPVSAAWSSIRVSGAKLVMIIYIQILLLLI